MNKNIRKVKDAGITLIALVVTIIVLLILAGVTINIALGNEGLIERTKVAREEKIIGDEKEVLTLAHTALKYDRITEDDPSAITSGELQQELANEGYRTSVTGTGTLRVTFLDTNHVYTVNTKGSVYLSTPVAYTADNSNVIDVKQMGNSLGLNGGENNYIYVLKESSNLYRYKYTSEIGTIDPSELEYVESGVARIGSNKYLTTDNLLYDLNGNLLGSNVKTYYGYGGSAVYYLNYNNELHFSNFHTDEKIGENIKEITKGSIITNSNELCEIVNGKLEKERDNVLFTNILYYVGTDNKLYKRSDNSVIATDVAKLGEEYYLTNTNKLKEIRNTNVDIQNVNAFEEFNLGGASYCFYKTQDDQEFFIKDSANSMSMPDYDAFIQGYYSKNNKLYNLHDENTVLQDNFVNFGVIKASSYNYWCQLKNKKIYYDIQGRKW